MISALAANRNLGASTARLFNMALNYFELLIGRNRPNLKLRWVVGDPLTQRRDLLCDRVDKPVIDRRLYIDTFDRDTGLTCVLH